MEKQVEIEEANKQFKKVLFALGVNVGSFVLVFFGPNYIREHFDGKINAVKQNNPAVARVYELEKKCYLVGDNQIVPKKNLERFITDADFVAEQRTLEKEHQQLMTYQEVIESVKNINAYKQSAVNYAGIAILGGMLGMIGSLLYTNRLRKALPKDKI
ncbi:hypothetical protein HYV79_03615 [Candidatus Woesearchaeota archaeon]|nr:hypothetical protein [Candidatus Woesearchaeota archaeon]